MGRCDRNQSLVDVGVLLVFPFASFYLREIGEYGRWKRAAYQIKSVLRIIWSGGSNIGASDDSQNACPVCTVGSLSNVPVPHHQLNPIRRPRLRLGYDGGDQRVPGLESVLAEISSPRRGTPAWQSSREPLFV